MTLADDPRPVRRLPKPVGLTIVLLLVVALIAGIAIGGRRLYTSLLGAPDYHGTGSGRVVVEVHQGDSARQIGQTLHDKGVVKSVKAFTNAARDNDRSRLLQPGFFALHLKMSGAAALRMLLDPKSRVKGRVTLPEGISLAKVVTRLEQYTDLKRADIVDALDNPAVLGLPAYAGDDPEGFLFPSTYDVDANRGAVEALTQMTERFAEEAAAINLEGAARALGISPYDVVKIASIVEAETPLDEDRPKVARVILNRLAKHMPLQLDSTVNYVREQKKARLSLRDIQVESPYNTYLNRGLPPTPIDSPGVKALTAALAPAGGDWLYFVTIDKAGHSLFTSSYAAFLAAKAKAQHDGVY